MTHKTLLPDGIDPFNPPQTWGELLKALRAAGFDADEYLSSQAIQLGTSYEEFYAKPLRNADTWRIACFWVTGGSEGYYSHVEEIKTDQTSHCYILGKFWAWERAQECANYAARLLNW